MSGLSISEIIDFAIVFIADEAEPRLGELPGHMRELSGGWFTPCGDVIRGRVEELEAAGFVTLTAAEGRRPQQRVRATEAGLNHAHGLTRKVAPQPCLALLVWRGLQMSLSGRMTQSARSALLLDLAHQDAALPAMGEVARDFAAVRARARGCAG
jgi:hypothetical protein